MQILTAADQLDVSNGLTVVKFGADWCGPCKILNKTIDKLENEFDDVKFVEIDVDQVSSLAQSYKIQSVPTLIFFVNGAEEQRVVGLSLIEPLRKIIRDLNNKVTERLACSI